MASLEELRKEITAIDDEMAALFVKRMQVSSDIAAVKKANGLPVFDPAREEENLSKAGSRVPEDLSAYYRDFLRECMELSKAYQRDCNA